MSSLLGRWCEQLSRITTGLMYTEFGHDAHKEKWNVTQETYFDTLIHLKNMIRSKRQGLLSQEVFLIHNNVHPHKAHLI